MSFKKTILLEYTDLQDFPGPIIFKDSQVLENTTTKYNFNLQTPSNGLIFTKLTLILDELDHTVNNALIILRPKSQKMQDYNTFTCKLAVTFQLYKAYPQDKIDLKSV